MDRGDFGFSQQSSSADYGAVSYHRSTSREKGTNFNNLIINFLLLIICEY